MSLQELRSGLTFFASQCAAERREFVGRGPGLVPSIRLDHRHSDLFRTETLETLRQSGLLATAGKRWRAFVVAGIGRLAAAEERQELGLILEKVRAGPADAVARDRLMESAARCAVDAAQVARRSASQIAGSHGAQEDESGVAGELRKQMDLIQAAAGTAEEEEGSAAYPAGGSRDLWHTLNRWGRFQRRGDGEVEHRWGPVSLALPLKIPTRVLLLDSGRSGILAYGNFLRAAGQALAWSHLPERLPAEDLHLAAGPGALVYGALLAGRLREPAWLQSHGLGAGLIEQLTGVARAVWARRLHVLLEMTSSTTVAGAPMGLPWWSEDVSVSAAAGSVAAACGTPPASLDVDAERLASLLSEHLRSRFGRLWDQNPRAADLLRDLWSVGWGRSTEELLSSLGLEDPDGELLAEELRTSS